MTPDEWKENNISFLPQLIHHCDNVPWDVQLTFSLHSTFNHFSAQSILTGMCWKLHHLILHIVFTCSLPGARLSCCLVTYNSQALWQHGNLMAVPVRPGLKHHPPRQGYPVLSEVTLMRAAARARNKHSELLLLLHLRRRSNVSQRIQAAEWCQVSVSLPPLEQSVWGVCPFQAVPIPCIILAQILKCHMQCPCAMAPAKEGWHCGDTLRPGPGYFLNEQSEPTAWGVLFWKELNCN